MSERRCSKCGGTGHYATTCLNLSPPSICYSPELPYPSSGSLVEQITFADLHEQYLIERMRALSDELIKRITAEITKPGYPGFEK